MSHSSHSAIGLIASVALIWPTASFADGKTSQARRAIAAAQAKIDASNIVGASGDAPRLHAQAVAALHVAQDELAHSAKDEAIRDANHAAELADMALTASQRQRNEAQSAATAQAQHDAAEANARAADAQAAAAKAQADAAAARSTPPVVVQTPAAPAPAPQTEATVTTTHTDEMAAEHPAKVRRRVVHHRRVSRPAAHTSKTTVTVKTHS
jgi:hypothetical protein